MGLYSRRLINLDNLLNRCWFAYGFCYDGPSCTCVRSDNAQSCYDVLRNAQVLYDEFVKVVEPGQYGGHTWYAYILRRTSLQVAGERSIWICVTSPPTRPCRRAAQGLPTLIQKISWHRKRRHQLSTTVHSTRVPCDIMAAGLSGRTRPTKVKKQQSSQKRKRDDVDGDKLQQAVDQLVGFVQDFLIGLTY